MKEQRNFYQEASRFWRCEDSDFAEELFDGLDESQALNPLDGRYASTVKPVSRFFSERAFIKQRIWVIIAWMMSLMDMVDEIKEQNCYNKIQLIDIFDIYDRFSNEDFKMIKSIEKENGNDIKAIEQFLIQRLMELGFEGITRYVNIATAPEDINNVAYARLIEEALNKVWIPKAEELVKIITDIARKYSEVPMLAYTKGQPAMPTTVGKEFIVYVCRLKESIERIKQIKPHIKFNGLAGNYSEISYAFPNIDWLDLSWQFSSTYLHTKFSPVTSQVESYDYVSHLLDEIRHFNNVLKSFAVDMSFYVGKGYFKKEESNRELEVMHQVDTVQFRHSAAQTKMSNSIALTLSDELPCACTQGDIATSTLLRNIGMAFGYSAIAIEQSSKGMQELIVDEKAISSNLRNRWEVLIEPIRVIIQKYGVFNAEAQIMNFAQGRKISKKIIQDFIKTNEVLTEKDKERLLKLTPLSYIGQANQIVKDVLEGKIP